MKGPKRKRSSKQNIMSELERRTTFRTEQSNSTNIQD